MLYQVSPAFLITSPGSWVDIGTVLGILNAGALRHRRVIPMQHVLDPGFSTTVNYRILGLRTRGSRLWKRRAFRAHAASRLHVPR
jgi:hypothetical protein